MSNIDYFYILIPEIIQAKKWLLMSHFYYKTIAAIQPKISSGILKCIKVGTTVSQM